jgi:hypothetical protein
MALPTARLAALLSPAGAAQIAASWPVAPLSASQALERLAALLPLVPDGRCWVVALRGLDQLSEADRLRFQASLAPFARGVTA